MQVDWTSGIVAAPPQLSPGYSTGVYLKIGPDGQVISEQNSFLTVTEEEPSHSRNFTVKCLSPGSLLLAGNPVKLFQGHNLFGSCDALELFLSAAVWVRQQVGLFPGARTWEACKFRGPRFTRLDLTRSYRFSDPRDVAPWVRQVAATARSRHGAAKLYGDGTAVWGEGSRRWMFKVYDKRQELEYQASRKGKNRVRLPPELMDWAAGVVRFELQLRTKELETIPEQVAALSGRGAESAALAIWQGYYDRITFNENAAMIQPSVLESALPNHLALKLGAWRGGTDMRQVMSKTAFYRTRRELLDAVGVDIASPAPPVSLGVPEGSSGLDPAGWDPEPLAAHYVEPCEDLAKQYGLRL